MQFHLSEVKSCCFQLKTDIAEPNTAQEYLPIRFNWPSRRRERETTERRRTINQDHQAHSCEGEENTVVFIKFHLSWSDLNFCFGDIVKFITIKSDETTSVEQWQLAWTSSYTNLILSLLGLRFPRSSSPVIHLCYIYVLILYVKSEKIWHTKSSETGDE